MYVYVHLYLYMLSFLYALIQLADLTMLAAGSASAHYRLQSFPSFMLWRLETYIAEEMVQVQVQARVV